MKIGAALAHKPLDLVVQHATRSAPLPDPRIAHDKSLYTCLDGGFEVIGVVDSDPLRGVASGPGHFPPPLLTGSFGYDNQGVPVQVMSVSAYDRGNGLAGFTQPGGICQDTAACVLGVDSNVITDV
jgi:hypothetical protein